MWIFAKLCLFLFVGTLSAQEGTQIDDIDGVCDSKSDASNFAIEGDCVNFYSCVGGSLYQISCPQDLAYNPSVGTCDWPYNVKGCEYVDGLGAEEAYCRDMEGNLINREPFVKPGTCDVFHQCVHGVLYETSCPEGLVFHPVDLHCVRSEDAPACTPGTTQFPPLHSVITTAAGGVVSHGPEEEYCKDENGNNLNLNAFPKPGTCDVFYRCVSGVLYEDQCAAGLVFSPSSLVCVYPYQAPACTPGTTQFPSIHDTAAPPAGPTPTITTPVKPPGAEETYCRDKDGHPLTRDPFLKPGTCNIFHQCVNGVLYETSCPEGLVFHPVDLHCVRSEDAPACTPGTTQFPPLYPTTTAVVDDTVVSEPEEKYCKDASGNDVSKTSFPKPGTCDVFYRCVSGVLYEDQCAAGLVFSPSSLVCVYPYQAPACTPGTTQFPSIHDTAAPPAGPTPTTTTPVKPPVDSPAATPTTKPSYSEITTKPTINIDVTTDKIIITPKSTKASTTTATIATKPAITATTTAEEKGKTYVGFVVDDTGSMSNEIIAVKEWIRNCISGSYEACANAPTGGWIITSFNDPDAGPVFGPTTNVASIISFIDGLRAHGGYDCPEYAMKGLKIVGEAVPDDSVDCKIYFFTDALAKDESAAAAVKQIYKEKGCAFLPMLTGCCGTCEDPCDSVDPEYCINHVTDATTSKKRKRRRRRRSAITGEELFYDLASETGGTIYLMDKPSSPDEMLEFLEEEVTLGFCPTELIAGPLPLGYTNESDCNITGSCWDRSVKKCYCVSATEPCPHYPILPEPICPKEGSILQPHPTECSLYYECNEGHLWTRPCAPGTVFDRDLGNCNHPFNTAPPCGTKIDDPTI